MKRRTIALGTALALIGATGLAVAGFADERGRGYHRFGDHGYGMHRGDHHGGHFGGRGGPGGHMFEQFDLNEDGTLTQEEVDQFRQQRLAEFDANGDGALDLEEYQALWVDAMRERMVDRFQAHDDDGDGRVTQEEFGERFARMVQRMDHNGDGVVDDADRQYRRGDRERMRDRDGN